LSRVRAIVDDANQEMPMKPTTLTKLYQLQKYFRDLERRMGDDQGKINRLFDNPNLPSSFEDALDTCTQALKVLGVEFANVVECNADPSWQANNEDKETLRKLNESLRTIGQFCVDMSQELAPGLKANPSMMPNQPSPHSKPQHMDVCALSACRSRNNSG